MTSLLTEQDIKNFILAAIEGICCPRQELYFSKRQICKKLNIHETQFTRYIQAGLKYDALRGKRKVYNIKHVIRWLNEHNIEFTETSDF